MAEVNSIVKSRTNKLEFEVSIKGGGDDKTPTIRFVLEDKDMNYTFDCVNEEDNIWVVTIPPMPQLTKKRYPFRVEVIIDGYYFEPFRKTLSIITDPEVDIADPDVKRPKTKVSTKKEEAPRPKKKRPVKRTEKLPVERKEKLPVKKKIAKEDLEEIISNLHTPAPKPEAEPIVEPEIIEDHVEDSDDSFASMADRWMNRDKPVLSEKDKKVKEALKGIDKSTLDLGEMAEVTIPSAPPPEVKVNDKDAKIREILGKKD